MAVALLLWPAASATLRMVLDPPSALADAAPVIRRLQLDDTGIPAPLPRQLTSTSTKLGVSDVGAAAMRTFEAEIVLSGKAGAIQHNEPG